MGYGYDESDSFIDNSEAVSTWAGVRVVKFSCLGGAELAPGENMNVVPAGSVPGLAVSSRQCSPWEERAARQLRAQQAQESLHNPCEKQSSSSSGMAL